MKKVLIVVISNKSISKKCLDAINGQDYKNFKVLINIIPADKSKNKADNIIINRNAARKKALKTKADYFFLIDSDTIPPKNALSNLMLQLEQPKFDKKAFTNLNIMGIKMLPPKKKHIIGGWYKLTPKHWSPARWVADNTLLSLRAVESSVVIVDKIALGCILMSREVLKKIKFRIGYNLEINKTKNNCQHPCMCAMFGIDAQDAGYTLYMDGSVICKHNKKLTNRC